MQSGLQKNFESFEKSTWKFFGDFFWATQDIVSWISFTYLQRFSFVHTETFYSKLYAKRMQESGSLWIFCGDNSSFFNFFKTFTKKNIIKAILCNFSMRLLKDFKKEFENIFAPQNIKKPASKVAHNPTRPRVLTPASIWLCLTETVF